MTQSQLLLINTYKTAWPFSTGETHAELNVTSIVSGMSPLVVSRHCTETTKCTRQLIWSVLGAEGISASSFRTAFSQDCLESRILENSSLGDETWQELFKAFANMKDRHENSKRTGNDVPFTIELPREAGLLMASHAQRHRDAADKSDTSPLGIDSHLTLTRQGSSIPPRRHTSIGCVLSVELSHLSDEFHKILANICIGPATRIAKGQIQLADHRQQDVKV